MKFGNSCFKIFLCISFSIAVFVFSSRVYAEVLDRIVASIEGEPVTRQEVLDLSKFFITEAEFQSFLNKENSDSPLPDEILKNALTIMLFEKEAKAKNIVVTMEEIEAYISQVEASNNAQEGALLNTLEEQGVSYDSYVRKIKSELLRSKVITAELASQIQVTDDEINEYLGSTKSMEMDNESDNNLITLVKVKINDFDPSKYPDKEVAMEEIRQKIRIEKSCDSIRDLGGVCQNLGVVDIKDLKSDLQSKLLDNEFFEPTEIFKENAEPYFYIKASGEFSKKSKTRVEKEIKEKLFKEKFREAAEKYLKEDLFRKYKVEIHS